MFFCKPFASLSFFYKDNLDSINNCHIAIIDYIYM